MRKLPIALLSVALIVSGVSFTSQSATASSSGSSIAQSQVRPQPVAAPSPSATPVAKPKFTLSTRKVVLGTSTSTVVSSVRSTGGQIKSFSVSPKLPKGLRLNTATGEISGKPSLWQKAKAYKVIGKNASGAASQSISIQIIRIPILKAADLGLGVNLRMKAFGLKNSGGAVVSYSITPELPVGLTLNTKTGKISGKPSALQPKRSYRLSATNISGTSKKKLTIEVVTKPIVTLSKTSYLVSPNAPFTSYTIKNTGGRVFKYLITPAAPAGMTFSAKTGKLTGTPTTPQNQTRYVVTATNPAGKSAKSFNLEILSPPAFTVGWAGFYPDMFTGTNNAVSGKWFFSTGGAVANLTIDPALPTGLTFNSTTGEISGTPTTHQAKTTYTLTASNIAGTLSKQFSIEIVNKPLVSRSPKNSAAYTNNSNSEKVAVGSNISGYTVSNTGDRVTRWTVSPELPHGLSINQDTGELTGSPDELFESNQTYTITAENPGGSSSFNYTINVVLPPIFSFSSYSEQLAVGQRLTGYTIDSIGGLIDGFSISPSVLPWMSFDSNTGLISGVANAVQSLITWTITANNVAGTGTKTFSLEVFSAPQFSLSLTNESVANGSPIAGYTIKTTGGRVTTYSISPALPSDLTFSSATGLISGTPTQDQSVTYTITGTNVAGTNSHTFTLAVYSVPSFALSSTSEVANRNNPIVGYTLIQNGGLPTSYSISPSVPAGLSFSTTTGLLSGSPSATQTAKVYTITAINVAGRSSATFTLEVGDPPIISLSAQSFSALQNETASLYTINSTGGTVTNYELTPSSLPAGLTFSSSTGLITGSPSILMTPTSYTLKATNPGGTMSKTFTLEVRISCSGGGPCYVGDTGPGGGKIVYVDMAGFLCGVDMLSTCHYLEAAPKNWAGGSADPKNVLYGSGQSIAGKDELTTNDAGYIIGRGEYNTSVLMKAVGSFASNPCAVNNAASYVSNYKGTVLNDWYLPNPGEMTKVVQAGLTGDWALISPDRYWTSSQYWGIPPGDAYYEPTVGTGGMSSRNIQSIASMPVRPVRTF
jgi:hypothetical protein